MGYCYQGKRLCCDVCGTPGARKRACPYGWCPPLACCATCWKRDDNRFKHKAHHATCLCASEEMRLRDEKREALLREGFAVRRAARYVGGDFTKVVALFTDARNNDSCFFMTKATYDAIPLGEPATPDDYRAHGAVVPCPVSFEDACFRPDTIVDVPAL